MVRPLLLAALLALTTASAHAEPRRPLVMARVSLTDLDLKTEAGAQAMLHRLAAAARQLCAYTPTPVFPGASGRAWRCRREAVAAAVARLDAPRLTLAFAEQLSAEPVATP